MILEPPFAGWLLATGSAEAVPLAALALAGPLAAGWLVLADELLAADLVLADELLAADLVLADELLAADLVLAPAWRPRPFERSVTAGSDHDIHPDAKVLEPGERIGSVTTRARGRQSGGWVRP